MAPVQANPIVWADVVAVSSGASAVEDSARVMILEYVNSTVNTRIFKPKKLKLVRVMLAAHIAANAVPDDEGDNESEYAGPVTSETTGGITRTYEAIDKLSSGGTIEESVYGDMYAFLIRNSAARLPFIAGR